MISRPAQPGFDADLDQFDDEDEFGFTPSSFPPSGPSGGPDVLAQRLVVGRGHVARRGVRAAHHHPRLLPSG